MTYEVVQSILVHLVAKIDVESPQVGRIENKLFSIAEPHSTLVRGTLGSVPESQLPQRPMVNCIESWR